MSILITPQPRRSIVVTQVSCEDCLTRITYQETALWAERWQAAGFRTNVLTLGDAVSHPEYSALRVAVEALPFVGTGQEERVSAQYDPTFFSAPS